MLQGRRCILWPVVLLLMGAGCNDADLTIPTADPPTELGQHFDLSTTGTIQGQFLWNGESPKVAAFRSPPTPAQPAPRPPFRNFANPFAPRIDQSSKGIDDVAVFLRGIDPSRSRPWDHPPAIVEQRNFQMSILQGKATSRIGFVRRGEAVEAVSRQNMYHVLRFRGDDFFTIPFPDPDVVRSRIMPRKGVVELQSGAGRFWMRAHLLIDEHPYFARTDSQGRFKLEQVPEGEYELVVWMPNWNVAAVDNDPGSNLATEVTFHLPIEIRRRIKVTRGQTSSLDLSISSQDCASKD